MSSANDNGGHGHGPARLKLDQMVALSDDHDRMARLAVTLTTGLDRLESQFDRATEKFSALVERQAASTMQMFEELTDRFKAVTERVIALEAQVARLKGQDEGPARTLQ